MRPLLLTSLSSAQLFVPPPLPEESLWVSATDKPQVRPSSVLCVSHRSPSDVTAAANGAGFLSPHRQWFRKSLYLGTAPPYVQPTWTARVSPSYRLNSRMKSLAFEGPPSAN
ncbi:hypothetical protein WMY93_023508 [Mugilogobius chulae]|uniref:Secreted protein n=1 Tax=Mugilogobius chulae TaxID=88201 RepID=A0AAW0N8W8_9GOBI